MTKTKLKVSGMHCASCAVSIDDSLEDLEGVRKASTSFARGRTKLEFDQTTVDLETVRSVIGELGYQAQPRLTRARRGLSSPPRPSRRGAPGTCVSAQTSSIHAHAPTPPPRILECCTRAARRAALDPPG